MSDSIDPIRKQSDLKPKDEYVEKVVFPHLEKKELEAIYDLNMRTIKRLLVSEGITLREGKVISPKQVEEIVNALGEPMWHLIRERKRPYIERMLIRKKDYPTLK